MDKKKILSLADFEALARKRLPRRVFGYIEGGVQDDVSVRDNRWQFDDVKLRPRVLRDTSARSTETTTLGQAWAAPFGIAPMGAAGLPAFRGDLAMARAAKRARIPFVLSGSSLVAMERVIRENADAWFQLYASADQADNIRVLDRAAACGFRTLVVTVDVPVAGNRERDVRNGYTSPLRPSVGLALDGLMHPRWLAGTFLRSLLKEGMPHFENYAASRAPLISRTALRVQKRDNLSWDVLGRMRELWKHRLVVKGILSADDVALCAQAGVDAVAVSNHGGRQLDGTVYATVGTGRDRGDCKGRMEVLYDSGIRRGVDVLKALGSAPRMSSRAGLSCTRWPWAAKKG